jgi:hypothetical protein
MVAVRWNILHVIAQAASPLKRNRQHAVVRSMHNLYQLARPFFHSFSFYNMHRSLIAFQKNRDMFDGGSVSAIKS